MQERRSRQGWEGEWASERKDTREDGGKENGCQGEGMGEEAEERDRGDGVNGNKNHSQCEF